MVVAVSLVRAPTLLRAQTDGELSDADVVARVLDGDRWAEEVLFVRHAKAVGDLVARLIQNRADAEDVLQETFVIVLGDLDQLRDRTRLRPWILRIAVRLVHRRFRRRKLLRALGLDRGLEDATLASLADPTMSPERRAELALLDDALRRIPSKERVPWMLHHVEGATLPEIAEACGCSLATTKRRIAAARARLDRHLSRGVER
jgi:RNA polymerase sigma-70 factor, ECF subfamily